MAEVVEQGRQDLDLGRDVEWRSDDVFIVVMGVSGTGKTTLGIALSKRLGLPYIEGDDLHPKSNLEKMSEGIPLMDEDRRPWLELIRERAEKTCLDLNLDLDLDLENRSSSSSSVNVHVRGGGEAEGGGGGGGHRRGVVVTCSALKKGYRDILRGKEKTTHQPSSSSISIDSPHPEESQNQPPTHMTMQTYFIWINGSQEVLQERIGSRQGHFFKASMLDSQLKTLESPEGEEGVVVVPLEADTQEQVRIAVDGLRKLNMIS